MSSFVFISITALYFYAFLMISIASYAVAMLKYLPNVLVQRMTHL